MKNKLCLYSTTKKGRFREDRFRKYDRFRANVLIMYKNKIFRKRRMGVYKLQYLLYTKSLFKKHDLFSEFYSSLNVFFVSNTNFRSSESFGCFSNTVTIAVQSVIPFRKVIDKVRHWFALENANKLDISS